MSRRPSGDLIDRTISELADGLPGGVAGRRSALLREARDGLEDATEAYCRIGLTEREAVARAVADFGDPDELRHDYAASAALGSVRTAAAILGAGYLLILAAWAVVDLVTPDRQPQGSSLAASSFSWIGGLAVLCTLGVLVAVRALARRSNRPTSLAWGMGILGLGCSVATLTASYLVQPWGSRGRGDSSLGLVTAVEIFSAAATAAILLCSLRCLRWAWADRRAGLRPASPRSRG